MSAKDILDTYRRLTEGRAAQLWEGRYYQAEHVKVDYDYGFHPADASSLHYSWPGPYKPKQPMHPDIGKRVFTIHDKAYGQPKVVTGVLIAVDDEGHGPRYLIKSDPDCLGHDHFDTSASFYARLKSQLHNLADLRHSYFAESYTLEPMKTLETLEVGDLVKCSDRATAWPYRRVLAVLGGEGESRLYAMSESVVLLGGSDLKRYGLSFTAFQLASNGYTPFDPSTPQVTEVTLDEVAQKMGIPVSQLRIKE